MTRYEECSDPERLAAHRAEHGYGSVEWTRSNVSEWKSSLSTSSATFICGQEAEGNRYRLVFPDDPTPERPEGLPEDAVEVPWFEHPAWVVYSWVHRAPAGWEWNCGTDDWHDYQPPADTILAFRQTPPPAPPATEDVPLAKVIDRTLPGALRAIEVVATVGGDWIWRTIGGANNDLPVNDDGTVTVLREDGAS